MRSLLLPSFNKAFRRGSHTTTFLTCGFSRSYNHAAPGSFFQRNVQLSVQPRNELQNRAGFRFNDRFHPDLSETIHDCDRNTFLVRVHAYIFGASHRGAPFWEGLRPTPALLDGVPSDGFEN